ncbi:MAG: deoxyribose-phosphate aldolase [Spirochaetes bacterium GWD1_61_31]|nr:MAG: deoxyribose-phosphate aldolase [Spirochaetes bacterium GWB1_60_80]OHD29464.1 MAG: deoxyribose-phosphate aldolase [Spirochaetes bacterium GWC1_61_12]OHD43929.1 MAG: deoxyribose-phosphate aldolase [Spirochaetes bacterium GWD1_61_31]OHD46205.1 MAG: deoxyribose-phosphate aldolase [Spirochaetes bacterium GWE1_60_18]OHD60743.1 MAG: deoxyribose-phosphate aldolase [Spirochaetes bacterium GWF1_60_12]HAP43722.1 deoxyribose-phosphate aldolase [Spirochaetaceae bacterium]
MEANWTRSSLAKTIDHTVLKAIATEQQVRELCVEAKANNFASVCVNPCWVPLCARELAGSKVMVCTVIGFPLGANSSAIKAEEATQAVKQGAHEVDMVINLGAVKSDDWKLVEDDIKAVVKAAGKATVKVILETCYLTEAEKVRACEVSEKAGAHFVKTSTGFGTGGATADDVRLMKQAVGGRLKVKASGGIRSYHDAIKMLEAGADRIGASSSVTIVSELPE